MGGEGISHICKCSKLAQIEYMPMVWLCGESDPPGTVQITKI